MGCRSWSRRTFRLSPSLHVRNLTRQRPRSCSIVRPHPPLHSPYRTQLTRYSCYQLFITIGILLANLINFGTESISNTGSWRIPIGISFAWALILAFGILLFPETPRFDFRNGNIDKARKNIAKFHGVSENHRVVRDMMLDLEEKLAEEDTKTGLLEVFKGKRMMYRILLGVGIQAFQQLTGANYFF